MIIHQCGHNVKTISTNGKEGTFSFKGAAIGSIAFHEQNKHIAIAEHTFHPKIYIYAYPAYNEVSVLEGKFLF